MRILLLTQVLPFPPDAGPKIKTLNLLKHLARKHQVSLVSFVRSPAEAQLARQLRPYCESIYTLPLRRSRAADLQALAHSMVSGQPYVICRDASPAMHELLRDLTAEERFDIVHADQLNMAQFALPIAGAGRVLDQHNAVWTVVQRLSAEEPFGPRRALLQWEWKKLQRYEGRICPQFDVVVAVSEEDRAALQQVLAGPVPMPVIPISIDTHETHVLLREPEATAILTIGTLLWPPNAEGVAWLARHVFPAIKQRYGRARLLIVGASPSAQLRRLARKDPAIEVTGYVPDPAPLIRESALMAVPVHSGGGMRVKILNALAQGLPIVSTRIGSEGIRVTPGQHLLVADTPEAFAAAAVRLLQDPGLGTALASAGRRLAEQEYDWREVCPAIDGVYEQVLAAAGARRPAAPPV